MSVDATDVIVIGDGVIGLSTAFELGRGGVRCHVFGAQNQGAASGAAAGLLAPSIGKLRPEVQTFFDASLALYPSWVDELRRFEPDLALLEGLLNVVIPSAASDRSPTGVIPSAARDRSLSAADLSLLEPSVAAEHAVFHPRDAAIDNGLLVAALRGAVEQSGSSTLSTDDPIVSIDLISPIQVKTRSGRVYRAEHVVLAAGAWSPTIVGLPRALPVVPLKGQMLALQSMLLQHAVMGEDIYLVPRRGEIVVGATAEHAGFDTAISPTSIEALRQAAIQIVPALTDAPVIRAWAGIRPATPDMLPIIGSDPVHKRLLYACGHSKNGILLAPATAISIAALAVGNEPPFDIAPFSIRRFSSAEMT